MISKLSNRFTFARLIVCDIMVSLRLSKPLDLMTFLSHPNPRIRWHAADSLYAYKDNSLINPVLNFLQKEPDPHVRKRLLWILETCKAWDEIFACLESPMHDVRGTAANILSQSGESRFVAPLLELLMRQGNQDSAYRQALFGLVDKSSAGVLSGFLAIAPSAEMKGEMLWLLGVTKDKRVFDQLVMALNDSDDKVRLGAVLGLSYLGDDRAISTFQKLLSDSSEEIRRYSKVALEEFSRNRTQG